MQSMRVYLLFLLAKSRFLFLEPGLYHGMSQCSVVHRSLYFVFESCLRFTDEAPLLEQAQKSSIWREKSIAFAFNTSIARDIYSRLVDFLHALLSRFPPRQST
jgi:hypothetical protein